MKAKMFVWIIAIVLVAIIVLLVTPKKTTELPKDIKTDLTQTTTDLNGLSTLNSDLNTDDLDFIDSDLAEIENLV